MPVSISWNASKAGISLKPVVVGGSIGGLAAAYTLQKAGHQVIVLDQGSGKVRSHGGLRSPPNMTTILNQWGLGRSLERMATKCTRFVLRKGGSGEGLNTIVLNDEFLEHLVGDFMFIQLLVATKHGDLHSLLYDLCIQEGVRIRYKCKVVEIEPGASAVRLENGERIASDFVIGADGYDSFVRPIVTVEDTTESRKILMLTFVVPVQKLQKDPELKQLACPKDWTIWLGNGYIAHGNIVGTHRDYTVTLTYDFEGDPSKYNADQWQEHASINEFSLDLQIFEPRIRKLLGLAEHLSSYVYKVWPYLENLVCERGKVALAGEAAHPLMPGGHESTALTIEDAQVLGCLLSRIQHKGQLPQLLNAYEEIRQPRCASVQIYDRGQYNLLSCPDGPEQQLRDTTMRQNASRSEWEHMDEETFTSIWGKELDLYAYDATEAVADWWTKWGSILLRGNSHYE